MLGFLQLPISFVAENCIKTETNVATASQIQPDNVSDRECAEHPEGSDRVRAESPSSAFAQNMRDVSQMDTKPWGYSGIDLMNTGAAFWQNYSGKVN